MVRVGDAHIGCGVRGDVGDHIVVDLAVVGVQPQIHGDVGVQRLKIRDGLLVDGHLGQVGIVLGPEGNLIMFPGVKGIGNRKGRMELLLGGLLRMLLQGAVAAREGKD